MKRLPDLSPVELEILGVLWKADSALKPAEIEGQLADPIKNANLRAILVGLVDKGVLKRELRGKAYHYLPTRPPETVRQSLAERMAAIFAEGSRLGLIAQLIRDENLTPEQVRELQQLAQENDESESNV